MVRSIACELISVLTMLCPGGAFAEFVCGPPPRTCTLFLTAKAVFTGRVIFVDKRLGLVRIRIDERIKGVATNTEEVWIDPTWSGPGRFVEDPGPDYREGEDWLVFASAFAPEDWKTRFHAGAV